MGLEAGNLKRLVHPELHIDEFKSKLGDDQDICVISFKLKDKAPALDLVSFIEKGYSWVVDADVSSGEMEDGDYIVFLEVERNADIPENIIAMMQDIMRLTEQKLSDWRVRHHGSTQDHKLTREALAGLIPLSPEEYSAKYPNKDVDSTDDTPAQDSSDIQESLDKLRAISGIKVTTKAPKNRYTESLRIAAGIR